VTGFGIGINTAVNSLELWDRVLQHAAWATVSISCGPKFIVSPPCQSAHMVSSVMCNQ